MRLGRASSCGISVGIATGGHARGAERIGAAGQANAFQNPQSRAIDEYAFFNQSHPRKRRMFCFLRVNDSKIEFRWGSFFKAFSKNRWGGDRWKQRLLNRSTCKLNVDWSLR
jgi:hypothetical protein